MAKKPTTERHIDNFPGQPKLRNLGAVVDYTEEEILEITKCIQDPLYFIDSYCKIVDIDNGLVNFHPYPYQARIADTVFNNRYTICKLPRQSGKTTILAAILAWHAIFQEQQSIACLAHKQDQAIEVLSRVKLIIENLPKWLQQGVAGWNKKSIQFENGSEIFAAATSSGSIRGRAISFLYLDEFAFIPNRLAETFYTSVLPTISSGTTTKIVITSTPFGFNLFYKLWTDAVNAKNDYKWVEINWNDPPGRDQDWKEEQIRNIGEEKFNQEYNGDFLGSTATLIKPSALKTLTYVDPIQGDSNLSIFESPKPGQPYLITVDSSDGVNRDYSSFVVIDIGEIPYKVVATYRNNLIEPLLYPDVIHKIARHYNDAWIVAENNNMGQQVVNVLFYDYEYENIFSTAKEEAANEINGGARSNPGVRTTKKTKRVGCSNLKTLIENEHLLTNDFVIKYELSRFVKYKDSYRAEEGETDDLVMCLIFFAWMTTQPYFKDLTNTDLRIALQKRRSEELNASLLPFGAYDDGVDHGAEMLIDLTTGGDFDAWLRNS